MGKLPRPRSPARIDKRLNTFDPCVLDDNAVLKLSVDVTVLDPREALHDMGNSSKVGVGIVLVTKDALKTIGNPFFTGDNAKVPLPLGKSSINMTIL